MVLAAEVGVIDLHPPGELPGVLALAHDLHDLVLHQPGRGIGNAEVALELQRGDVVLGLRDQVHRHEPGGQRQLAGLEDRAGDQAALVL